MKDILVKVYGHLEFDSQKYSSEDQAQCLLALHAICQDWYLDEDIFSLDDNLLTISYEGTYFPHEEVAMILAEYISKESKGKMDFIDLEAWTLQRFFLDAEHNSLLLGESVRAEVPLESMKKEPQSINKQRTEEIDTIRTKEITATEENLPNKKTGEENIGTTAAKNKMPYSRKSSLNHALEASQEKNGAAYKH